MPDLKKVLTWLEICGKNRDCSGSCPYVGDLCRENLMADALELLKEQEAVVRCKDCKHLFDGEHTKNCCDALMEKVGWLKEISVSPDWFCADGERR